MTKEAADTFREMFKEAAKLDVVASTVKLATSSSLALQILKHPAVAYGLGATALGLGLPAAYALGKDKGVGQAQALLGEQPPVYPDTADVPVALSLYQPSVGFSPEGYDDYYSFDPDAEPEYDFSADAYDDGDYR